MHGISESTDMKQLLALLGAHIRERIAEDKADCRKEVALAGAVAPHNHVVARAEGVHNGLVAIGLEPLYRHLLDVHRLQGET